MATSAPAVTSAAGQIEKATVAAGTPAPTEEMPAEASRTAKASTTQNPEVAMPTAAPSAGGPEEAYLLITVRGVQYEPIALDGEGEYTLRQKDTGAENTIHVTKDSIWMSSSTCENQDCVEQDVVSLENRQKRLLQNMIICLPNEVTLELLTAEEAAQVRAENEDAG